MIISIGYRVKSKNGILFRKWATNVLKEYMIKGYAINNKRLEYLEKTVKLLDIANRGYETTSASDSKEILRVITEYTNALNLLDDYKTLKKISGKTSNKIISYSDCIKTIQNLKFNEESDIFALERDFGLKSILNIFINHLIKKIYIQLLKKKLQIFYIWQLKIMFL